MKFKKIIKLGNITIKNELILKTVKKKLKQKWTDKENLKMSYDKIRWLAWIWIQICRDLDLNQQLQQTVGTRNTYRNLERSLKRVINNTNLPQEMSLNILRYTFGSTLIRRCVSIEVVSKLVDMQIS